MPALLRSFGVGCATAPIRVPVIAGRVWDKRTLLSDTVWDPDAEFGLSRFRLHAGWVPFRSAGMRDYRRNDDRSGSFRCCSDRHLQQPAAEGPASYRHSVAIWGARRQARLPPKPAVAARDVESSSTISPRNIRTACQQYHAAIVLYGRNRPHSSCSWRGEINFQMPSLSGQPWRPHTPY